MNNRDLNATWAYHNATKHSYWSVRSNPHSLDWENQPLLFKIYATLEPIPLPQDLAPPEVAALSAISALPVPPEGERAPDLKTLAQILHFCAGITKRRRYPGGEILFRAAACTGALYHIELYLVCADLPDLEAGVYHFGVHDFSLRRLRPGDYRGALVQASGGEPFVSAAPVVLVSTGTYWRNAWKYQARAYRHCYWDNGTILANLLALAAAHQMPAGVVTSFVDSSVNRLLGLDPEREVALTLVPLGRAAVPALGPPPEAPPLALGTLPLSRSEVDYPAIRAMHAASSLVSEEEARAGRGGTPIAALPEPSGRLFPLRPLGDAEMPQDGIAQVILRRGSTRRFAREPISFRQLSTVLHRVTREIPADFLDPPSASLCDLYLIVNAVAGLPSGAYVYRRDKEALELLKEGNFRHEAGYLGLEQELAADASADVFFLADLRPILERYGNRGYRMAQLEAAMRGGKLYLAAYALGLGASGLTFYDDEVTAFFSPHAAGKSVMFLVTLGRSARQRAT